MPSPLQHLTYELLTDKCALLDAISGIYIQRLSFITPCTPFSSLYTSTHRDPLLTVREGCHHDMLTKIEEQEDATIFWY